MSQSSVVSRQSSSGAGLRPPAFAAGLVAQRMAGRHPLFVNVVFGRDWARAQEYWARAKAQGVLRKAEVFSPRWREQVGDPWVAVGPRQFAPGMIDWRGVAGCWVRVHDGESAAAWDEDNAVLLLCAEVGRWAAPVTIEGGPLAGKWVDTVADWLRCVGSPRRWPRWWSDDLNNDYWRRFKEWQRAHESFCAGAAA